MGSLRKGGVVLVTKLDRLGRSTRELLDVINAHPAKSRSSGHRIEPSAPATSVAGVTAPAVLAAELAAPIFRSVTLRQHLCTIQSTRLLTSPHSVQTSTVGRRNGPVHVQEAKFWHCNLNARVGPKETVVFSVADLTPLSVAAIVRSAFRLSQPRAVCAFAFSTAVSKQTMTMSTMSCRMSTPICLF
jgi:hypothetical protein